MTTQEIRKLSNEEILEKIKTGKSELLNLRLQNARSNMKKYPHKINALKKDIARMMTILKEREIDGGNE